MGDYNRLSASAPRNEILYDEPEEQSLKHSRSNDEDEGEGGYNASNDNEKSLSPELLQEPTRKFFKSSKSLHSAISVAAGTVMMLFGYEQGVFGGIVSFIFVVVIYIVILCNDGEGGGFVGGYKLGRGGLWLVCMVS